MIQDCTASCSCPNSSRPKTETAPTSKIAFPSNAGNARRYPDNQQTSSRLNAAMNRARLSHFDRRHAKYKPNALTTEPQDAKSPQRKTDSYSSEESRRPGHQLLARRNLKDSIQPETPTRRPPNSVPIPYPLGTAQNTPCEFSSHQQRKWNSEPKHPRRLQTHASTRPGHDDASTGHLLRKAHHGYRKEFLAAQPPTKRPFVSPH